MIHPAAVPQCWWFYSWYIQWQPPVLWTWVTWMFSPCCIECIQLTETGSDCVLPHNQRASCQAVSLEGNVLLSSAYIGTIMASLWINGYITSRTEGTPAPRYIAIKMYVPNVWHLIGHEEAERTWNIQHLSNKMTSTNHLCGGWMPSFNKRHLPGCLFLTAPLAPCCLCLDPCEMMGYLMCGAVSGTPGLFLLSVIFRNNLKPAGHWIKAELTVSHFHSTCWWNTECAAFRCLLCLLFSGVNKNQ